MGCILQEIISAEMLSLLIGLATGVVGYLVTTFWMQPILRYRDIRERVHSDLIFYADVVNADGLNDDMKTRMWKRIAANRRHSVDLRAIFAQLPGLYRGWLSLRGCDPERVSEHLMGLSNTFDYEKAAKLVKAIRAGLRLPSES